MNMEKIYRFCQSRSRVAIKVTLCMAMVALFSMAWAENQYPVEYSVPSAYKSHQQLFQDASIQLGDTPVWALTDHISNVIMIEGDEGVVIFDTGFFREAGERALAKLQKLTSKPVVAVIYSHHHGDHTGGAGAFIEAQQAANGTVKVIAAHNLLAEMSSESLALAPISSLRNAFTGGVALQGKERQDYHIGCCGDVKNYKTLENSFIPPNTVVEDVLKLRLAGIDFELYMTGGEAASGLIAYLPEYKVLLAGDEIQGPTFPNLHSLRGTKMRDANNWIGAVDRMRSLDIEHLVPSHGNPVSGNSEVAKILTVYRDAIQYTHDQALRYMNKGYSEEALAEILGTLPEYLQMEPWTTEYYGTVEHSVRSYYTGYISWFSGDAVELQPTPAIERAKRTIDLMGGSRRVLEAAERAFKSDDPQWSAELATLIITMDPSHNQARQLKAAAFRQLGYQSINSNWKGFYLMGAKELDGSLNIPQLLARMDNPANMAKLSVPILLDSLRYRIDSEIAGNKNIILGIKIDGGDPFTLTLRNSILQISEGVKPAVNTIVTVDRQTLAQLMYGTVTIEDALTNRGFSVSGDKKSVLAFFKVLDKQMSPTGLVVKPQLH
ncbi:MAG: MBL fold metallo-hydrolase [Pseudomonadales bacterium]|nr:MAG: MBL fold metallo-hydrolase [Pseudomonadales bacterium]